MRSCPCWWRGGGVDVIHSESKLVSLVQFALPCNLTIEPCCRPASQILQARLVRQGATTRTGSSLYFCNIPVIYFIVSSIAGWHNDDYGKPETCPLGLPSSLLFCPTSSSPSSASFTAPFHRRFLPSSSTVLLASSLPNAMCSSSFAASSNRLFHRTIEHLDCPALLLAVRVVSSEKEESLSAVPPQTCESCEIRLPYTWADCPSGAAEE